MAKIKLNKDAVQRTNKEFYERFPERANRPLTMGRQDAGLRAEWLALYKKHAGPGSVKKQHKISSAPICGSKGNEKKVFVYLYTAAVGWLYRIDYRTI